MTPRALDAAALLEQLPPVWPEPALSIVRRLARGRPMVVLDDDPTGTQTVRDVPVVASHAWNDLAGLLERGETTVFLLTNSRSLDAAAAARLGGRIGRVVAAAERRTGRPITVVSRGDSTLRGHFPGEVDALAAGLGRPDARILLLPALGAGGRITVGDTHFVVRGGTAVPVGETEYARDASFGYRASNLVDWVHERAGADRPVASVSLAALRRHGPTAVSEALLALPARAVLVVNAAAGEDAEVAAAGSLLAERAGLPVICRTAADFVRGRAGQPPRGLLAPADLAVGPGPGLVVVGSHVPATSRQLAALLADQPVPMDVVELDAGAAADPRRARSVVAEATGHVQAGIASGRTIVLMTSRSVVRSDHASGALATGSRVSKAVVAVVAGLRTRPGWVVAKGGITSSDLATAALGVRVARVLGQVRPGVPLWRTGRGSRWPRLLLAVFPGNVGTDDELRATVATFVAAGPRPRSEARPLRG